MENTLGPLPSDPPWLVEAWRHLGKDEVKDAAWVLSLAKRLPKWVAAYYTNTVKQPWCALGMSGWLAECGFPVPKNPLAARSYCEWGVSAVSSVVVPGQPRIVIPVWAGVNVGYVRRGAVTVLSRVGGGHVGILLDYERATHKLVLLGANQVNSVSIQKFDGARALAFRWAAGYP